MRTRDERKNEGIKRDEAELSATFHKFVPGLGSILQRASYFHGLFFPIEKPIDREERFHGPHRDRLTWRCSESVLFRGYNRGFEILRGQEFELGKKRAVIFRGTSDPFHARPTLSADPQAGKNSRVRFDSSRSIVVRIAFNMERCGLFSCSPERIYFFQKGKWFWGKKFQAYSKRIFIEKNVERVELNSAILYITETFIIAGFIFSFLLHLMNIPTIYYRLFFLKILYR